MPSTSHRRDIQGLRALAVLVVIADHAGAGWLTGGFVGVDVFFVVSGYLITLLLLREAETTGRLSISRFYARRARRILPAATLVLLVTMAYAASELSLARVQQLREDATWSALFVANVHFARLGTDYFAQAHEPSPVQHYWSLAVEEQFYLVWPLLLASVLLLLTRLRRSAVARTRSVTGLLLLLIGASLAWSLVQTHAAPGTTYFSSPARAWELGVGALLAVQEPRLARLRRPTRWTLGSLGLLAVAAASVLYDAGSAFPGWRALLPVLGTAALVAAGTAADDGPSRLLTIQPLPWLGDLSYSLYLWHWPILVLGPRHSDAMSGPRGTALLLAATLLIAAATYYVVEDPLRHSRLLRPGSRSLVLWPAALATVLVGVVMAERQSTLTFEARMAGTPLAAAPFAAPVPPQETAQPPQRRRSGKPAPSPAIPPLTERIDEALRAADAGAPVLFPLTNLPKAPEGVLDFPLECIAQPGATTTRVCPLGDKDARRSLVVLGDSQAWQWLPTIDLLGHREEMRVIPLIKHACTPFDVPVVEGGVHFWQCDEFRARALDHISKVRPDVVLVGGEYLGPRLAPQPSSQEWDAAVFRRVDDLQRQGARVVVLGDTPDFAFDPVDCLMDPDSTLGSCVGVPQAGLAAVNAATRQAAERAGGGFLDPLQLLCRQGRCPIVVDRTMIYWDNNHVSLMWATSLADDFGRLYRQALGLDVAEEPVEDPRAELQGVHRHPLVDAVEQRHEVQLRRQP